MPNQHTIAVSNLNIANDKPFVLLGGLNVLETLELTLQVAEQFVTSCQQLGIPYVFKASFDKANRTSIHSFRGPGLHEGLKILQGVKEAFSVPIVTDVHEPLHCQAVADVADIIQIPAFLCRQTDLIMAACQTQRVLHIKKGQFLAAEDMQAIINKCGQAGNKQILLGERGTSFGYHNLVVDMLGFPIMKAMGYPIIFDVTHSLQTPGSQQHCAGGRGQWALPLARSAMAQGLAGLFIEAHPNPEQAKCDGPCALPLDQLPNFLKQIKQLDEISKAQ